KVLARRRAKGRARLTV
ncbi:MAG: 50S ribosomal protein L34, partial [Nitrospira sp.]